MLHFLRDIFQVVKIMYWKLCPASGEALSKFSATDRAGGISGSRVSLEPIKAIAQQLLTASLAKRTWESYTIAIEGFLRFRSGWSSEVA